MSNYRRLISYIYAYEGGVKGKNIGFAKIEAKGNQCKITVSVKRIYVGGNDIGVYLLAGDGEISLGNIFIRSGAGEFRTTVSANDVEYSGISMDQCYGLTVHDVKNTWRSYTTIWEDAVAHAAEVILENKSSKPDEYSKTEVMNEQIKKAVREIEKEFPLNPERTSSSMGEPQTLQAEMLRDNDDGWKKGGKNYNQTYYKEKTTKKQPESLPQPIQSEWQNTYQEPEPISEEWESTYQQPEAVYEEWESTYQEPEPISEESENAYQPPQPVQETVSEEQESIYQQPQPIPETVSEEAEIILLQPEPVLQQPEPVPQQPEVVPQQPTPVLRQPESVPQPRPMTRPAPPSRESARTEQEIVWQQPQPNQSRVTKGVFAEFDVSIEIPVPKTVVSEPPKSTREEVREETFSYDKAVCNRLGGPERRREREDTSHNAVWEKLKKEHGKILSFDYEHGCEILTIKPQDIGLLPRDIWVYGNNSFLLHGYYNFRYLIIAKLFNPHGAPRYLLGVPGHYYSNERYMAAMFGFPNFVLSKDQPAEDGRFGYWYTDIKLGA